MASINYLRLVGGRPKANDSSTESPTFSSVIIGANALEISDAGASTLDFNGNAISNVGNVDGRDVSADGSALDGHLDGGVNKHDASELDFEDTAVSAKNLAAGSVEAALTSLDDAIGDLTFVPSNYTNPGADIVADHLSNIDTELGNRLSSDGSVAMAANLDLNSNKIVNLAAPTAAADAATKAYVDGVAQGLDIKDSVRALSDADIDLGVAADPSPVDGVTLADGDRIALTGQTAGAENGIYDAVTAADPTTWVRSADADSDAEVDAGMFFFVEEGTTYGDTGWVLTTNDPITLDTTSLAFSQFSGAGAVVAGDGLTKNGNTLDVGAGNGIAVAADSVSVQADSTGGANLATVVDVNSNGVAVKIDDSSIGENGSNQLEVKDDGVTAAKLNSDVVSGDLAGGLKQEAGGDLSRQDARSLTNDNAGSITIRQIVYVKSDGDVDLAQADALATSGSKLGVVADASINAAASGNITLRKGAVIGGFSGLTPGAAQFLSDATAGALTETPPSDSGDVVVQVGEALSATEIEFNPQEAIEIQ